MHEKSRLLFEQAIACIEKEQDSQAVDFLQELIETDPDFPQAKHQLGLLLSRQGKYSRSMPLLREALILEPQSASIHNHLATSYRHLEQEKEAEAHYKKAIELNPEYAEAHNNLAGMYAVKSLFNEALHYYNQALHIAPDFTQAHFNLGLLFLKMRNRDAAKIQFNNVLSLHSEHPAAAFYMGVLLLDENRLDEADEYFRQVLSQFPEHTDALTNRGVIALKKGQPQLAIDYFTKALAFDNNHQNARNNLAATFIHHDRFENALTHYQMLLEKYPKNLEYHYNAGVAEMALGHLNEAIVHFEKVLELDESHNASLNNLASVYLKQKDRENAKKFLLKALEVDSTDVSSRHMLNALENNQATDTCPEYAANLFNNYAIYYDSHMQGMLHYSLPEHMERILKILHPEPFESILDAGCGTGLSGMILRKYGKHLTGVDISTKMLAQAVKKEVYNTLVESELLQFLVKDHRVYDLIAALDVFPYFGNVKPLLESIYKRLEPQGFCLLSIEIANEKPWVLQSTARFAHHPQYLKELCETLGFVVLHEEEVPARVQNGEVLSVMVLVIQK